MKIRRCFPPLLALCIVLAPRYAQSQNQNVNNGSPVYVQQEGFVDANGVMIYYRILGRGEPLLIVHGGPGASHDYLLPYLLPLARRHKLLFIDERGSAAPKNSRTPPVTPSKIWWKTWNPSARR